MHAAWQRLCGGPSGRYVTGGKRVRSAAVVRFFECHVVESEKQLCIGDRHWFFLNIKLIQLEETKKVESQCVRAEEGRLLQDKGRIRERWARFFRSLLKVKSDMLDPDIPKRLPQQLVTSATRDRAHRGGDCHSDEYTGKHESSGAGHSSRGAAINSDFNKAGPSCWSSTDSPPSSGTRGKSHSSGRTRS